MKALVTGCAGFIGSHLTAALLEAGNDVTGVDCFTDYYEVTLKEKNVERNSGSKRFSFLKEDLVTMKNLDDVMEKSDYVFHLAAQPGVRASWGRNFEVYARNNILLTQRLLEAARGRKTKKFVFASSSSVYGDCPLPMKEDSFTKPVSPYGISKLACEHLGRLYLKNYKVPVVCLRYFTVFGPGQRPDMAFNKFIHAIMDGKEVAIYGDGSQSRDFTYVDDIVDGTIKAALGESTGIFNLGGGSRIGLLDTIKLLEELIGRKAIVKYSENEKGDMRDTCADIGKATKELGYNPGYDVKKGLRKEVEWIKTGIVK